MSNRNAYGTHFNEFLIFIIIFVNIQKKKMLLGTILSSPPVIQTFSASQPLGSSSTQYSNGTTLTISFDQNTDMGLYPSTLLKSDIDGLFTFNPSIGSAYNGSWTDAKTVMITVADIGSATPAVGVAQVTPNALIRGIPFSAPSTATATLSGSFIGIILHVVYLLIN